MGDRLKQSEKAYSTPIVRKENLTASTPLSHKVSFFNVKIRRPHYILLHADVSQVSFVYVAHVSNHKELYNQYSIQHPLSSDPWLR